MQSLVCLLISLLWSSLVFSNEINISTISKEGNTLFYLQAGAFNLEKDAKQREKELASQISVPIEIKNLADKRLYLVQIGPIDDYVTARNLKDKLSQKTTPSGKPAAESNSTLTSQLPKTNDQQTLPPDTKLWNLRNADIRAVIAEVSRVTGKNFVIDPRVQGKISIISSSPMNNAELYQVFLSVLQVSGYAAIPNGSIIKIIPNIDAKTLSPDLLSGMKNPPRGDDMMVAVVPVHYVPAEQLVPALRPLMPQWSSVSAYGPSNMLILSGRANNIKSMADIIKQVDSSTTSGIEIVHLNQALAMDVANTLKDLVKTQPNMGARAQITIAADDRSNSILINGSKTDRIRLRLLILKLDKGTANGANSNTQVVYLHYLRAEDLVPILAGIAKANFTGSVGTTIGTVTRPVLDSTNPASNLASNSNSSAGSSSSASSSQSNQQANAGLNASAATANTSSASTQNEGTTKPTVQIIAEPNTNSIILNAPPSINRTLKRVIGQLDIKPAQLLIEAMVVDVSQTSINDLGIEWGSDQQLGTDSLRASSSTSITGAQSTSFGPSANFRRGFAIINSQTKVRDLQAQIYALASDNKANILSTPSVVVLDNRQAKILVGKQVSVAGSSYPNNGGGTTTASPFTTFERVNVALHLYVRPQITQGEGIQLQIDQGNDTLDPTSTANSANPTFSISSIVTSVHIESGDIVVLGGLSQDSLANNNNSLPILGQIPGLGKLFQRNIRNRGKNVLMVFIRPIILRNEKDNLQVTGEKYNNTRKLELDWIRSQDAFNQTDDETVLRPLPSPELPTPFGHPVRVAEVTK